MLTNLQIQILSLLSTCYNIKMDILEKQFQRLNYLYDTLITSIELAQINEVKLSKIVDQVVKEIKRQSE